MPLFPSITKGHTVGTPLSGPSGNCIVRKTDAVIIVFVGEVASPAGNFPTIILTPYGDTKTRQHIRLDVEASVRGIYEFESSMVVVLIAGIARDPDKQTVRNWPLVTRSQIGRSLWCLPEFRAGEINSTGSRLQRMKPFVLLDLGVKVGQAKVKA